MESPRTSSSFFHFETVDKFTAISRKSSNAKMRPHQVDLPVELSQNQCALRSGNCALSAVNHSTRVQDRCRAALWLYQQFPADIDRAGDCDRASCCESSAMHRLHRFANDFFDSHFFALRFAVGSQCPKFDSQTAMRYRVNYSLRAVAIFFLLAQKITEYRDTAPLKHPAHKEYGS